MFRRNLSTDWAREILDAMEGPCELLDAGDPARPYATALRVQREKVDDVSLMEFGTPEAMWHLTVEDFPAIVTMDAHGNSLHKDVETASGVELDGLATPAGK